MTQHDVPGFRAVYSSMYLGDLTQLLPDGQAEPIHGQPTVERCSRRGTDVVGS